MGEESDSMDSGSSSAAGSAAMFGGALVTGVGNRRALAQSQRNFNSAMEFNRYMSSTQYQRGVEDLKKAGLNPMLAYMNANASSASVSPPQTVNEGSGVGEQVSAAGLAMRQNKLIDAQTNATNAQAASSEAAARKSNAEALIVEAEGKFSSANAAHKAGSLKFGMEKLAAEMNTAETQKLILDREYKELQPLLVEMQKLLNRAQNASLPEKEAIAEFYRDEVTKASGWWREALKNLSGGVFSPSTFK